MSIVNSIAKMISEDVNEPCRRDVIINEGTPVTISIETLEEILRRVQNISEGLGGILEKISGSGMDTIPRELVERVLTQFNGLANDIVVDMVPYIRGKRQQLQR